MQGKDFRIVIVAESYNNATIKEIISNFQTLGNEIHKFAKQVKNIQESKANTEGITDTTGESISKTEGKSETKGSSDLSSKSKIGKVGSGIASLVAFSAIGGPLGMAIGATVGLAGAALFSKTENESKTTNSSTTNSTNSSKSISSSKTDTKSLGITFDEINKSAEYCEKLVDKYIERFQKGLNHGMWNTALYIQADDEVTLAELQHTLKSVYSGDETYFEQLRFSDNLSNNQNIDIKNLPMLYFDSKDFIHPIHKSFLGFTSAINSEELSILSSLPNSDVDGVSVTKISSFGLTQAKNLTKDNSIEIGKILNKKKDTNQKFKLSLDSLNSHLFVSGITGGGKSNTIKGILEKLQEKKIPFLVIEPAKSEYKHLLKKIPNLQIFRPGAKDDIFKFNPFVFEHSRKNQSVTLTKHVDMLKTTFSSAFPMYGPMPYILEEAIYNIYKTKGWSFDIEDHPSFTDSDEADYDRKSLIFPNMEDLKNEIERVVNNAGYHQELQSNIKAALKTRINNLTLGVKGKIFNSRHNINAKLLFERPTIIELSNIVDDEEKAFLMGLLLNKLYSYKEEQKIINGGLNHITVVEEAHRLLPNISLDKSSEDASSRAKSIETFINILAEIRAYGEGIIIADQIASKLHRDVIKNTNIKIIHRTMDYEDRQIVGKAINLSDEQILDIAELKSGEAIVHNKDVHQAFMVRIDEFSEEKIDNNDIKNFYEKFLKENEIYKYEYIFEKWFYLEYSKRVDISRVDLDSLKIKFIKFINTIFFDSENILKNWEKFKSEIDKQKDENLYIYIAVKLWNKLNYLSNLQYYKNIDRYLNTYDNFINLLLSIKEKENIIEDTQIFKNSFKHSNLINIYPSMKSYNKDDIDYTMLILENISSMEDILEFIEDTMKEDRHYVYGLDKVLNKIFKTTNENLRHSLGAIRAGKEELYLPAIIKKEF